MNLAIGGQEVTNGYQAVEVPRNVEVLEEKTIQFEEDGGNSSLTKICFHLSQKIVTYQLYIGVVAIRKQKNKAYILLESLVALATLVTICSLILSAVDAGRRRQVWELEQQEVFNLAQMAVQTKQDDLALNGVAVQVQRTAERVAVFHEGKEVLSVVKSKIPAFTLLECLVVLVILSGSLLIFEGLSKLLVQEAHYQGQTVQKEWLVFSSQLRSEGPG